mmetsp:Transcript_59388/g.128405  ORF Transcript_59388/g.128405 Transcript_59388/m.128405 type:complete len:212 (+) Transcript_59388:558-1193(+)
MEALAQVVRRPREKAEEGLEATARRQELGCVEALVPFPYHVSAIACTAKRGRKHCISQVYPIRLQGVEIVLSHLVGISARQQGGPRGCADFVSIKGIQANSIGRQRIDIGCGQCWIIVPNTTVAQIIGKNEHNVGPRIRALPTQPPLQAPLMAATLHNQRVPRRIFGLTIKICPCSRACLYEQEAILLEGQAIVPLAALFCKRKQESGRRR